MMEIGEGRKHVPWNLNAGDMSEGAPAGGLYEVPEHQVPRSIVQKQFCIMMSDLADRVRTGVDLADWVHRGSRVGGSVDAYQAVEPSKGHLCELLGRQGGFCFSQVVSIATCDCVCSRAVLFGCQVVDFRVHILVAPAFDHHLGSQVRSAAGYINPNGYIILLQPHDQMQTHSKWRWPCLEEAKRYHLPLMLQTETKSKKSFFSVQLVHQNAVSCPSLLHCMQCCVVPMSVLSRTEG